jgi:hypothetical protein
LGRLPGAKEMSCDEKDRRTGTILRAHTPSEGTTTAIAAEYGIDTDTAETPGEAPDDAAIVSDITHDTDDDHSISQATADSHEWNKVKGRASKTRRAELTWGNCPTVMSLPPHQCEARCRRTHAGQASKRWMDTPPHHTKAD